GRTGRAGRTEHLAAPGCGVGRPHLSRCGRAGECACTARKYPDLSIGATCGQGWYHAMISVSMLTIPIGRPTLGEDEAIAVSEAISSGWVMQGPCVERFEGEFANYVGAPYACAVS